MIVIVDYGMGNLRSVAKALSRLNNEVIISGDKKDIARAEKLILPGVGHFAKGMESLKKQDLVEILNQKVLVEKTPILGICLGIQLFTEFSEEGNVEGLGWIKARTEKFDIQDISRKFTIPHMGWNTLSFKKQSELQKDTVEDDIFYFVHSYHLKCENASDVLSTTIYGYEFVSAIEKGNIFGTQFHPEKSHKAGLVILRNFTNM